MLSAPRLTHCTSDSRYLGLCPATSSSLQTPPGHPTLTQFPHYLPGVGRPLAAEVMPTQLPLPTLDLSGKSGLSPALLANQLYIEGFHDPLSGFDNLPEWLIQLTRALDLLFPVHHRGHSSGTGRWQRGRTG